MRIVLDSLFEMNQPIHTLNLQGMTVRIPIMTRQSDHFGDLPVFV